MRHSPSRRRSGFTFIEMLIVFVVFAAVATISVRSVGDTLRRDRVAKVGAILGSDIEQAFAIAARQRQPVRMLVDRTNKKFSIVDRNTPTVVYKTRSFAISGEYGLDSLWSNRDTIDIMPSGLSTDTLKLSLIIRTTGGATYQKSVRASKGGLVRVDNR
ncbi:MAG TPA: prepilin-type N-terminal cleavage/methylation domain-containing protein [Gemmatimonadaceae bacterium]|nr:prepilin-type N-terminal cleavage/methylation domain-containing protein [Gemmatimonadaceae bacterium]